ncbi:MAG: agmatinase [Candidatus Latescibacteria bacterium]|nr:agmatinase [Candidatus Latescibacterota bacterium]
MQPPPPEESYFHIIPVPYEKSVSYGKGTAAAPSSVLVASQQLELFDGTGIPAQSGIFTHSPVDCYGTHEETIPRIEKIVNTVFDLGKFPILIGGEHTVTLGTLPGLKSRFENIGIIQFDAHADLRDTYQGTPYSHACVMHRALDFGFPMLQIGIRSLEKGEHILRKNTDTLYYLDANQIFEEGIESLKIPESFPRQVYITFDVDVLDPSIMPATGTPEPGGLGWYDAIKALHKIIFQRKVVGMDIVELAPVSGLFYAEYTVARLIYNTMGFLVRKR